jgi:hypothetical protein
VVLVAEDSAVNLEHRQLVELQILVVVGAVQLPRLDPIVLDLADQESLSFAGHNIRNI